MKRWFLAAAIGFLVINIGWFVYSEVKTRRLIASIRAQVPEPNSHPHVAKKIPIPDVITPETFTAEPRTFTDDSVAEIQEESDEVLELMEELLNESDEECCAEDDVALTDDWDSLSWDEKIRRTLKAKHGDIPEIERYIEFESVYHSGGNLTVAEVLEHLELRVKLYSDSHDMLAHHRELASSYSPDDIVTVKRTYGGEPSSNTGTTVRTEVHHPNE